MIDICQVVLFVTYFSQLFLSILVAHLLESPTLAMEAVRSRPVCSNVLVIRLHEDRCLNGPFTSKNKRGGIIVSSPGRISNYYGTAIESNIK